MEKCECIIPISGADYLTFGFAFKGTDVNRFLVAKLADRGQRYLKKIEKHHP
jgi:hypothetical protein